MSEQQTTISPEMQLDMQLTMRRAKKYSVLNDTIPSWPESIVFVFSILFVYLMIYIPNDSEVAKIIILSSILIVIACQWHAIVKLRSKVEVLSEIVKNSNFT
jgi:hypothetical protein